MSLMLVWRVMLAVNSMALSSTSQVKKQVEGIRQKWNAAQSQRTVTLKTSTARGDQLHTRTPLWNNFFERLELATANEHGRELMKSYGVATREWE